MKGIETKSGEAPSTTTEAGSDHCPAMKGIETKKKTQSASNITGSDHCPAMKGIETPPPGTEPR